MEDQDKTIQRYPKNFDNACSTRPASEFCLHITGYTVHFQSIDLEDLREGNVYMGPVSSLCWLHIAAEQGERSAKPQKSHIVYS